MVDETPTGILTMCSINESSWINLHRWYIVGQVASESVVKRKVNLSSHEKRGGGRGLWSGLRLGVNPTFSPLPSKSPNSLVSGKIVAHRIEKGDSFTNMHSYQWLSLMIYRALDHTCKFSKLIQIRHECEYRWIFMSAWVSRILPALSLAHNAGISTRSKSRLSDVSEMNIMFAHGIRSDENSCTAVNYYACIPTLYTRSEVSSLATAICCSP